MSKDATTEPQNTGVISQESAEASFETILEHYDIDPEDALEVSETVENVRKKIVRALKRGRMEIQFDNGRLIITQHLRTPIDGMASLTYYGVSGRAKVATGIGKDDVGAYTGMYKLTAAMTKIPESKILGLMDADLGLAESITSLFMLL